MTLDSVTLNIAFVLLSVVLGSLLIFSWGLNRKVSALAWWGAAFCLIATGIAIANLGRPSGSYPAILIGNVLGLLAYVSLYAGCRVFNGREGFPVLILTGVVLWVVAYPLIHDKPGYRLILATISASAYAGLAAWELWRHAAQPLTSQRVAVALLTLLAVLNFLRAWLGISLTSIPWIDALANRWSSEMALFLVVYMPTLAFIFLSMAKESVELGYKRAAYIDSLTGIPNRRAFFQHASHAIGAAKGGAISCLIFDLDNFKMVNDRYGHEVGDRILTLFGQVLTEYLPQRSFGRLGGEEFGAILPIDRREAAELAEIVRHAFWTSGKGLLGPQAQVTVSVGCAASANSTVKALLREADRALYRAKEQGRNIVISA